MGKASVIDDIFASAKEQKRKREEEEAKKEENEREKDGGKEKRKRKKKKGKDGKDTKGEAFVAAAFSKERDDVDLNSLLPRYKRKKTNEGFAIYSEKELRINQGGGTDLCPFDCNCCF